MLRQAAFGGRELTCLQRLKGAFKSRYHVGSLAERIPG